MYTRTSLNFDFLSTYIKLDSFIYLYRKPAFQILSEILTEHKLKFQNRNFVENVLIISVEDFVSYILAIHNIHVCV